MLNGATANLPADAIIESGVCFAAGTPWGVTLGPPKFDPGKEITNLDYDGKRSDVQTLDRIIKWNPRVSGTLIEFGGSTTGNQLGKLEPGSTSATHDHGTTTRIQPRVAGAQFVAGEYITDFRLVFERANGGYAAIYMPIALIVKYSVEGQRDKEAKVAFELKGVLSTTDAVSSPGKCPYSIELRTSTPS